jgi:hypothetical protein
MALGFPAQCLFYMGFLTPNRVANYYNEAVITQQPIPLATVFPIFGFLDKFFSGRPG